MLIKYGNDDDSDDHNDEDVASLLLYKSLNNLLLDPLLATNLSNNHRLSSSEESQQYEVYGETPVGQSLECHQIRKFDHHLSVISKECLPKKIVVLDLTL